VASLSQGRTAAAQCGLFTHKSVPVIFEPPCISLWYSKHKLLQNLNLMILDNSEWNSVTTRSPGSQSFLQLHTCTPCSSNFQ